MSGRRTRPAAMRGRVLALPQTGRRWHKSLTLSWAAAATFAVAAGYAFLRRPVPGPGPAGPFVLTPATPARRAVGREAVVSAGPGGAVTLAVDLGGSRFDGIIRYELRGPKDRFSPLAMRACARGRAPLLLFIPSGLLMPAGGTSQRAGLGNETTTEDYRFTVGVSEALTR